MTVAVTGTVDPRGRATLQSLVDQGTLASALYQEQTGSTNSDALEELRREDFDFGELPRLILADRQIAGRGRHGRDWEGAGHALMFSFVDKAPTEIEPNLISLAVGVGISRAIEFGLAPLRTRLKWPNDVYVDGGKCAGILLEATSSKPDCLVIGVGINVIEAPDVRASGASVIAKSLAEVAGRTIDRFQLLDVVINELVSALSDSDSAIVDDFRSRCVLTGNPISFMDQGSEAKGVCTGIADTGELLIETELGLRSCCSGEIHQIRPA